MASKGRKPKPPKLIVTSKPAWVLPMISILAGSSIGIRQYTRNADGLTLSVTDLAAGLSYNASLERIEADAEGTAASGVATFTIVVPGGDDVVATTTVALEEISEGSADVLWQDDMKDAMFLAWSATDAPLRPTFAPILNLTDAAAGYNGPGLQPPVTFKGSGGDPAGSGGQWGNGWHCTYAKSGGGDGHATGPALTAQGRSIRFQIDNDEAQVGGGPPYNWNDQIDPQGGNTDRRRSELHNRAYALPPSSSFVGKLLYPNRQERWHAWAMYIPSDWDITRPTGLKDGQWKHTTVAQFKNLGDTNPWMLFHIASKADGSGHAWRPTFAWEPTVDGNVKNWYWSYRYSVEQHPSWDSIKADYPNEATSLAALASFLRGGWTYWAIKFRVDRRTLSQGGAGYFQLYKREEGDSAWTHVIDAHPRQVTVGSNTYHRGIGVESGSGGAYARFGFYNASGAEFTKVARPMRSYFLGRAMAFGPASDLDGIWTALNS